MILAPTLTLSAGSGAAIVRPTFSRDFAGEKSLNNGTGPAITFTRASNATFFDANGDLQTAGNNVPRFDHDPASGNASRGLLIEEARTNLLERSEEFDNAYWTKQLATVTPNAIAAPDGTMTADKLETNTTTGMQISRDVTVNASSATFTVFLKKGSGATQANVVQFRNNTTVANILTIRVNLDTGAITTISGSGTATATNVGSDWWRVAISGALTSGNSLKCTVLSNFVESHAAGEFVYAWGAQLEQGAFPTSYIPTTSAAATRSADSAVVTPIASFYNGTEGTIYNEFSVPVLDGGGTLRGVTQFAEASAVLNRLQTGFRGTGLYNFGAVAANVGELTIDTAVSAVTAGAINKAAQAYKSGDSARSFNGGATGASSTATLTAPTRERLRFGDNGTGVINGHIRKVAYYPKRLTNTLLQQLTT